VAWQRDGVGAGQESLTLIAYDEAGMAEAVGSLYEAMAGIEPLTRWTLPSQCTITPATAAEVPPALSTKWSIEMPDRVTALAWQSDQVEVLSYNGRLDTYTPADKSGVFPRERTQRALSRAEYTKRAAAMASKPDAAAIAAAQKQVGPQRLVKFVVKHGDLSAIAYWGGTLEVRDAAGAVKTRNRLPQDITALVSAESRLLVGLADGRVMALAP
jgi:hypothetical protein